MSDIKDEVIITLEELEAIRLTDLEGKTQQEAGEKMNISQSSVSRHLDSAHHKIAKALVLGFAIQIANTSDFFHCDQCGHTWYVSETISITKECEKCGSHDFHVHSSSKGQMSEIKTQILEK